MALKIDSNITGLAFAEEISLKTLPVTPIWYELEPNSYSDFGSEIATVARNPINPSRQRRKGVVTDLDASGGFNTDFTQSGLQRLLQGFFFAAAREKFSTAPLNGTQIPIIAVDGVAEEYEAASGLTGAIVGNLILASNFGLTVNNGLKRVITSTATALGVAENLSAEVSPPATAKVEVVGFQFATGDLNITASVSSITLTCTAANFILMGLTPGEWIFVGGDSAPLRFANVANVPGYARIKAIAATVLTIDETTWVPVTEIGTGLTIQIFFGVVIRNEKIPSLITRRTIQLERTLGNNGTGIQSEYLVGAVPNEFGIKIPQADKLNADLTFVALDNEQHTGTTGIKSGTRVSAKIEDAFNTSSDIYRIKLSIIDPVLLNPIALFAFVSEAEINIANNVTPNKAVAILGAFETTAGDFQVSGSMTVYFSDILAVAAVRNNSNVAFSFIAAKANTGFVYDIPLLSLGGGRVNVEKDAPITLPLETNGAENVLGYTLLTSFFNYLPTVAMPA